MTRQAQNFIIVILALLSVFVQLATTGQEHVRCKWDEYYDDNMDNCGPCREICDHRKWTKTEEQCLHQCSEYLTSLNCTYEQYYDDVVKSCAPCSELCDKRTITDTTEDCSNRCQSYLTAESCTDDQYYDEKDKTCTACAQLCSKTQDEMGTTDTECFKKCPKYVERHPPVNIVIPGQPAYGAKTGETKGPETTKTESSTHPGVTVTIVLGALVVVVVIGAVFYLYRCRTKPTYAPAPRRDTEEGDRNADNGGDEGAGEVQLEMEELRPVQVCSENVAGQTAMLEVRGDDAMQREAGSLGAQATNPDDPQPSSGIKYGIPECDPLAPSSAASRHVRQTRGAEL